MKSLANTVHLSVFQRSPREIWRTAASARLAQALPSFIAGGGLKWKDASINQDRGSASTAFVVLHAGTLTASLTMIPRLAPGAAIPNDLGSDEAGCAFVYRDAEAIRVRVFFHVMSAVYWAGLDAIELPQVGRNFCGLGSDLRRQRGCRLIAGDGSSGFGSSWIAQRRQPELCFPHSPISPLLTEVPG